GLVIRQRKPEDKRQVFYALTEKALDLVPVLLEIGRWSTAYDENSATPPALLQRYTEDPQQLINELQEAARLKQR
ncbi:MAG: transcriptional regulator, partial [Gammaproteobacteria bacterium]|nr:transcriptional regulator [Gammaproteobacteria bacterium]